MRGLVSLVGSGQEWLALAFETFSNERVQYQCARSSFDVVAFYIYTVPYVHHNNIELLYALKLIFFFFFFPLNNFLNHASSLALIR